VLRRVGGYNLDIFHNQNERPYTNDGTVNLAHLLVGSEGTLALTKSLTLRLSELPRAKVLGVVNFPTFYKAMDSAQHIVKLGADGTLSAVELVDRTMIELALQNPAFAPTVRTALSAEDQPGQARRHPAGGVLGGRPRPTSRQKSGNWSNSWVTSACPAAWWK
jgi:FAD/FMN-containing dehydrogenase